MFKIFKKYESNNKIIEETKSDLNIKSVNEIIEETKSDLNIKSVNEIIEEIHETFYTEVDKLLFRSKIINSLNTDKQYLVDKCERLQALGFTNTKEVKEAKMEIERLNKLKQENESKKNLVDAINYFSFKYPNYKFITEDSVKQICKKYNLVYGTIDKYIGSVPDINLKHIENFKIQKDDECYLHELEYVDWTDRPKVKTYKNFENFKKSNNDFNGQPNFFTRRFKEHGVLETNRKCSLEIVAPLNDFNMVGMKVEDYNILTIQIPDPIVLQPVIFNNQKHYLIVTAWGIEARDEIVINPNNN